MKTKLLLLTGILFLFFSGFSQQTDLTVDGFVFEANSGGYFPVANQPVEIMIDSTDTGYFYQNTVFTDEQGYYSDIIPVPPEMTFGLIHLSTFDSCLGYNQEAIIAFINGSPPITYEFVLCDNFIPDCEAIFVCFPLDSNTINPMTFQFQDVSIGTPTGWNWDFGDGISSSEQNPVHTYTEAGIYTVCLTIDDSVTNCTSTFCLDVIAGDPGFNSCENFFFYFPTGNPNELTFEGFMIYQQVAESYTWDFGDGTTATGQSVTHTFPADSNEMYVVCLTTEVLLDNGDTCVYTTCQDVLFNYPVECQASFFYYPGSDTSLNIQFQDWSFTGWGGVPDSWAWDFGDGSTSTLQNPIHTYADTGYYEVCLTITDSLGNCTDTYCETIFVENIFPPQGCESFFYYDQDDTLTFTFYAEAYLNGMITTNSTIFEWDFGDGTTGSGQTVTHTFPADSSDIYFVCLTASTVDSASNDTCVSYFCDLVFINGLPGWDCYSSFSYFPDTNELTLNFEGFTQSQFPTTWTWEFGDGTTGTGQFISHIYDSTGTYNVTLTTTDSTGCTWTSTQPVWVGEPEWDIVGTVFLDSNLVADVGIVRLMTTDSLFQTVIQLDSTEIQADGSYTFEDISLNNFMLYFVQAELTDGSIYFGSYLPTYHISSLTWQEAFPVLPIFGWTADIFMIPGNSINTGNGTIGGNVTSLGTRGQMEGVHVMIMDEDLNPYTYVTTDSDGYFEFDNLAYGTYVIHAEMMGIHTTQAVITLSEDQPESQVSFIVEGNQATLSVSENPNLVIAGSGEIYPNPVSNQAWIEVNLKESVTLDISIYNQIGQRTYQETINAGEGNQRILLNTSTLKPGIHLLNITSEEGDRVSKRLIKAQ